MELIEYVKGLDFKQANQKLSAEPFNLKLYKSGNRFIIHGNENATEVISKQANGQIFDCVTGLLLAYAESFAYIYPNVPDGFEIDLENSSAYEEISGTYLRYYNFEGKWYLSTRKTIDAYKSQWLSNKTFGQMFEESKLFGDESLDKHVCYTFIMKHPDMKGISKTMKPLLILNNAFDTKHMKFLNPTKLSIVKNKQCFLRRALKFSEMTDIYRFLNPNMKHVGVEMHCSGKIIRFLNPRFIEMNKLMFIPNKNIQSEQHTIRNCDWTKFTDLTVLQNIKNGTIDQLAMLNHSLYQHKSSFLNRYLSIRTQRVRNLLQKLTYKVSMTYHIIDKNSKPQSHIEAIAHLLHKRISYANKTEIEEMGASNPHYTLNLDKNAVSYTDKHLDLFRINPHSVTSKTVYMHLLSYPTMYLYHRVSNVQEKDKTVHQYGGKTFLRT